MLKLNEELCTSCGICEESCPFAAIELHDDLPVIGDTCTLCGACVEACPVEALEIELADKVQQDNLDDWQGIMVYAEYRCGELAPVSLELLGAARNLAQKRGLHVSQLEGLVVLLALGHGRPVVVLAGQHHRGRLHVPDERQR